MTVQPRGCGERVIRSQEEMHGRGSAPRVRGTLPRTPSLVCAGRFSPAGAGNAPRQQGIRGLHAVQPRGCGERTPLQTCHQFAYGSAPRVRGTLDNTIRGGNSSRFSPAGAGNAEADRQGIQNRPVQPRGCGERVVAKSHAGVKSGSAPRVRGTQTRNPCNTHVSRFSPAGAGNAAYSPLYSKSSTVQPRGCGERALALRLAAATRGSAPRVRGTL